MTNTTPETQKALAQIAKIETLARKEDLALDAFHDQEKSKLLSKIAASAWKRKAGLQDELDALLSKKSRTQIGLSTVRLEKLLLELDRVDTMGIDNLRARRKQVVALLNGKLSKSDAMYKEAQKIVNFQERLAVVGKNTLRSSLETGMTEENTQQVEQVIAMPPQGVPMSSEDDNHHVRQAQEESDKCVEDFYLNTRSRVPELPKQESSPVKAQKRTKDSETTVEPAAKKTVASAESAESPKLEAPLSKVEERQRSFVIHVQDRGVGRAQVTISQEGILSVAIPNRKPLKFDLGTNVVNVKAVTKEIKGDVMELVLPKLQAYAAMRNVHRPMKSNYAVPASGLGGHAGRRDDDFWSRF